MFIGNLILSCVQIQGGLLIWHSHIQTSAIVLATFLVSVIKRQTNKQNPQHKWPLKGETVYFDSQFEGTVHRGGEVKMARV